MVRAVIAIHGGAGAIARASMRAEQERHYTQALADIVAHGQAVLAAGGSALDAVTEAVRLLEECPLFNAGKGAVFTHKGTHELDASVMDGRTLAAGAVAGISQIRNPILAARAVLENSPHVLLTGEGAEAFAAGQGLEQVAPDFFSTAARWEQLERARDANQLLLDHGGAAAAHRESDAGEKAARLRDDADLAGSDKDWAGEGEDPASGAEDVAGDAGTVGAGAPLDADSKFGTVGAVALDLAGNLAAATSTGGMTNKQAGRVGDSPIVGAGCYASNATVAVSCTGTGEVFMRLLAAYDIAAQMEYGGLTLAEASDRVILHKVPELGGSGGAIAIDRAGNVALPFNCEGMYRGYGYVGKAPVTGIYREEPGAENSKEQEDDE
ncbi:isoaspartyl peptidase/L-asparaginase [Erwinia tasmaniensis]|uniref:isoaspartyl peptidase/L-asparaginase n=1 Tax=Erwinia tasmaniensis TaxID=338565 RepID=UPI003A4DF4F9